MHAGRDLGEEAAMLGGRARRPNHREWCRGRQCGYLVLRTSRAGGLGRL